MDISFRPQSTPTPGAKPAPAGRAAAADKAAPSGQPTAAPSEAVQISPIAVAMENAAAMHGANPQIMAQFMAGLAERGLVPAVMHFKDGGTGVGSLLNEEGRPPSPKVISVAYAAQRLSRPAAAMAFQNGAAQATQAKITQPMDFFSGSLDESARILTQAQSLISSMERATDVFNFGFLESTRATASALLSEEAKGTPGREADTSQQETVLDE